MRAKFFLLFSIGFLTLALVSAFRVDAEEAGVRVIFIGDVMAHQEQLNVAKRGDSWDFAPQFRRVKPLLGDALVVANLETVFAGEKRGFAGYPSFNTPDELAGELVDFGVDVVTLANNHILDRGSSGAARTIEVLAGAGIMWTGLGNGDVEQGEPLVFERAGFKWAFVNYTYGSNNPVPSSGDIRLNVISDETVTEGIRKARLASPDVIAAFFHWGNEYQLVPTKRQRELAELSVREGANLVVGTHPHVLQPVEVTSSDRGFALVAYSLGNFVSNQRTLPRERSVILAVDVERAPDGGARLSRASVAPTHVLSAMRGGRRFIEVVYAGESPRFNHSGITEVEIRKTRLSGRAVLDFLGAASSPDDDGFYTLWNADFPDIPPAGRRKSPQ
jgi:poly-gamma-glutamate synthesis protein (capsule biosynthesis protein)